MGNINVNDGKGLMDNEGLCDSLLNDLNIVIKSMACGQYVNMCIFVTQMAQKITNLKKGIASDIANKNHVIEELKAMLREGDQKIIEFPAKEKE